MTLIQNIVTIFLLVFMISCKHSFDFSYILTNEKEFHLTVHLSDQYVLDSAKTILISKDSKKVIELVDWFEKNSKGWKTSIASWAAPDYFLSGKDFRLMVYDNVVVIGFIDENGKAQQYSKKVDKSGLNFLLIKQ